MSTSTSLLYGPWILNTWISPLVKEPTIIHTFTPSFSFSLKLHQKYFVFNGIYSYPFLFYVTLQVSNRTFNSTLDLATNTMTMAKAYTKTIAHVSLKTSHPKSRWKIYRSRVKPWCSSTSTEMSLCLRLGSEHMS